MATNLLTIELQRGPDGYRASVHDIGEDAILYTTEIHADVSDAVRDAQKWIEDNG